jgi:UDP-N-acetylglucosamine--N-acetylmuramyl-(pentapeptide) pyrophosphoryl-undecaprenol N-acetylglucosamine transferase
MRIVFSGGGTGGHIFPAVAVAQEVQRRYPQAEILFIGAQGKMEMTKVPKAGFEIKGLWISGLQRKLTLRNLLFPIKLVWSLMSAYFILKRFNPDAAAGFGGYASGAALYMATLMKTPTLIQEQNSYPGITNKILAKRVSRIAIAYDKAQRFFPKDQTLLTGNPIRSQLQHLASKEDGKAHFNLDPNKKTVLIIGGSLGARTLNRGIRDNYEALKALDKVEFIWQCGQLYIEEYKSCQSAQLPHVQIMAFIDDMKMAYAAADIVVSRAGALSVSELCAQQKATILVPSPNVAEDHQTKNAMALVEQDAAIMIEDKRFAEEFLDVVSELIADHDHRVRLEQNIGAMAHPRAVELIADELIKLAQG